MECRNTGPRIRHCEQRIFRCEACDKNFSSSSCLRQHVRGVHSQSFQQSCPICGKVFSRKGNLQVHIDTVHMKLKPFKCDLCTKAFGERGDLKRHVNNVHKKLRPFQCPICLHHFGQKMALKTHMDLKHHKDNFMCQVCGKAFSGHALLVNHIENEHSDVKPYLCEHCDLAFFEETDRQRHMLKDHKIIKV